MTDPISDMLTRIKNAGAVSHQTVSIPFSKIKVSILRILKREGFIEAFEKKGKKIRKSLIVKLRYTRNGGHYILGIQRVSKPGRKVYKKKTEIFPVKQGYGLMILSTPQGLMTNKEARKKGVGGEVMFKIW